MNGAGTSCSRQKRSREDAKVAWAEMQAAVARASAALNDVSQQAMEIQKLDSQIGNDAALEVLSQIGQTHETWLTSQEGQMSKAALAQARLALNEASRKAAEIETLDAQCFAGDDEACEVLYTAIGDSVENLDEYNPGTEVSIGSHRFRCVEPLGKGSQAEVWTGEELNRKEPLLVALKDLKCEGKDEFQRALFKVDMMQSFAAAAKCSYSQDAPAPRLRIPQYRSHRVDEADDQSEGGRLRIAMTRVPGEPVEDFIQRPAPPGLDAQSALLRGCMLAKALIKQLGPTLELIGQKAVHRDVNPRNVLLSDAVVGGPFNVTSDVDPEKVLERASFWLIDFGQAVEVSRWHAKWRTENVCGTPRYWSPSSWFQFLAVVPIDTETRLRDQYVKRLDVFGLGITALTLLCMTALSSSETFGGGSGSAYYGRSTYYWRNLLDAWHTYWTDVNKWHEIIFTNDEEERYTLLDKENVLEKINAHMSKIRHCLQDCADHGTEDPRIQRILTVLAKMLDESSDFALREAVEMLGLERMSLEDLGIPSR